MKGSLYRLVGWGYISDYENLQDNACMATDSEFVSVKKNQQLLLLPDKSCSELCSWKKDRGSDLREAILSLASLWTMK